MLEHFIPRDRAVGGSHGELATYPLPLENPGLATRWYSSIFTHKGPQRDILCTLDGIPL